MVDTFRDIKIDTNRDIIISGEGDLALTTGKENIKQSVAINVTNTVRNFLGQSLTAAVINDLESAVTQELRNDVQVGAVERASVIEVDKTKNSVKLVVRLEEDEDFTIEVSA